MDHAETISKTEASLNLAGRVWCFVPGMRPHPRSSLWLLGVAILGEAGWTPLNTQFDTFNEVMTRSDELNKLLPYTEETCIAIVADTMHRSRRKAEEPAAKERVYTVKVAFDSERSAEVYEDAIHEEIVDLLHDNELSWDIDTAEVRDGF